MPEPNVIRLVQQPGVTLELRTDGPLPPAGYEHVAKMTEAGTALAALAAPAPPPRARKDFLAALTDLIRVHALDLKTGTEADVIAAVMDEARMRFDKRQQRQEGERA